jgi:hypothetical protein
MPPKRRKTPASTNDAIVLFQDGSQHWYRGLLKRGFRHCAIIIKTGDYWVLFDPNLGYVRTKVMAPASYDMLSHYDKSKILAVRTYVRIPANRSPFFWGNCVGVVQALLGISNPFIITPHQLYKAIR